MRGYIHRNTHNSLDALEDHLAAALRDLENSPSRVKTQHRFGLELMPFLMRSSVMCSSRDTI